MRMPILIRNTADHYNFPLTKTCPGNWLFQGVFLLPSYQLVQACRWWRAPFHHQVWFLLLWICDQCRWLLWLWRRTFPCSVLGWSSHIVSGQRVDDGPVFLHARLCHRCRFSTPSKSPKFWLILFWKSSWADVIRMEWPDSSTTRMVC